MSKGSKISFPSERNHNSNVNVASWLKWEDSDLNNEKWAVPQNGPDGLFLDVDPVTMPRSLEPKRWIRAKDLKHLTSSVTVTTDAEYPDLITNNKHLLRSEFIRWFISALINLQYIGRNGLEVSGENSSFYWAGRHNPWNGWMHIYSLNKAGKNAQHRPVINPNGKYIVRLYCAGCWRRVLVDDTVPVDKNGRPLLPRTSNNFELWPMLLAKALLKVASLTWTERREIVEFHPVSCLTGWACLVLKLERLSLEDKWELMTKYSKRFEWEQQIANDRVSENSKSTATDSTRELGETQQLFADAEKPMTLFLLLNDMRELGKDVVPGLSPCWAHVIYVVQSCNIPLDPKDVKPPLVKWKSHRWVKWAMSQNIINTDYFVPIRYLRVISPLQERGENCTHVCNENNAEETTTAKEEAIEDVSQWVDFYKLEPYIVEAHLFFNLEHFQCSVRVTDDALKMPSSKTAAAKNTKNKNKDTSDWFTAIPASRNKALYLFCDFLEKKFLLVTLCAALKQKGADSRQRDYLILRKYNWFFGPNESDRPITISAIGDLSIVVELEAGRQLLQIYHRLDSSPAIISSNTDFYLGNRATVQRLMTAESDRIELMSKTVTDSFREACRSFGTKDFPATLKKYYGSYMPDLKHVSSKEDKNIRIAIHHSVLKKQIRLIAKHFPDDELENIFHSLRVLFLNPDIRLQFTINSVNFNLKTTRNSFEDRATENLKTWSPRSRGNNDVSHYDQAATTVQSFFKMALVKQYKQFHSPDHALHMQIRKNIEKISELFDLSLTSLLLRNVINRHVNLSNLYPCSGDFAHVLNIQEFGDISENIKHEQWFPIVRLAVNSKQTETVLAAFELLADLPNFALRVFNNENGREMRRVVSHVAPARYEYLPAGYTVFAYGWNEKQHLKKLDWTIRVITVKGEPMLYEFGEQQLLSPETKTPKLSVKELAGTYIPNVKNCLSRWIVRAISGSVISIRLATSYNLAQLRVKVTDERGNILTDVHGGFTVLLPLVILKPSIKNTKDHRTNNETQELEEEFRSAEEKSLYYIEALVLHNSWPLTDVEWTTVIRAKMESLKNFEVKSKVLQPEDTIRSARSDLTRKETIHTTKNDNRNLEPPYWTLQVVSDAKDAVEIHRDKRREEELTLLKESWSKDPERCERGKEIRRIFLNTYVSTIESEEALLVPSEKYSRILKDEDMIFCFSQARQDRTLKPPKSHHRLPALNLTRYVREDEIPKRYRVKTKNDDEALKQRHTTDIIDSQENYSSYLRNLAELSNERLQKYAKFLRKKTESFWKRRALIDTAYKSRKIYVDNLTLEEPKLQEKNERKNERKTYEN